MSSTRLSFGAALTAVLIGSIVALAAACGGGPSATVCENSGIVCPEGTECAAVQAICIINSCGNGVMDPGELCDDGNIIDGDGCSADCLSLEVCGNLVMDPGEVCDDGNNISGDGCSADCKSNETCGNNIKDVAAGEVCDDGNNVGGDGCSANCKSDETCGNGIVDTDVGEVCDTKNMDGTPNPSCEAGCRVGQGCGNGVLDPGEECDDGNTMGNDDCVGCKINICGDGIVDSAGASHHEDCDDGSGSAAVEGSDCNLDCTFATCGDGKINNTRGEQCDNGSDNGSDKNCTDVCKVNVCGDGKVDDEAPRIEECDDANGSNADGCSAECTLPHCGNNIVDQGEDCDDGNANNFDGCVACHFAKCGDGFTETGVEQCDGSGSGGHSCSAGCTLQQCGNRIIDPGETCDDGNTTGGDGCGSSCQVEFCGDGLVNNNGTEQCDPAGGSGSNTPAHCNSDCTIASCGDGKVDKSFVPTGAPGGEQCDPPSSVTGCSAQCQLEHCGDGHTDTNLGEACDNGSANNANGPCLTDCQLAVCGDGDVETASSAGVETCDNGSANGTTACPYGATSCTICTAACKTGSGTTKFCGDHNIDAPQETCDDATNGASSCAYKGTNAASNNCTVCDNCQTATASGPYCGDAHVDSANGETCDNGFARNGGTACTYGSKSCTVCTSTCGSASGTSFSFCGDGVKNGPEACDQGSGGSAANGSNCNADCTTAACGDGVVNPQFTVPGTGGKKEQCEPPGTATCDATCQQIILVPSCGNNVSEFGEECDGTDLNGSTCGDFGYDTGTLKCFGSGAGSAKCTFDTSSCADTSTCGNNVVESGEQCDGNGHLNGASCTSLGYDGGALKCFAGSGANKCTYDTSACTTTSTCNNGSAEAGEQCDELDLNGATCATLGYNHGALACTTGCKYNVAPCSVCGNGSADGTEACDGSDLNGATCGSLGFGSGSGSGTLGCKASCTYDTSGC